MARFQPSLPPFLRRHRKHSPRPLHMEEFRLGIRTESRSSHCGPRPRFSFRRHRFWLTALVTFAFTLLQLGGLDPWLTQPAYAATNLTIEPLTWDFIGLDSNNVNVGPNEYLTGARVCNVGSEPAQNLKVRFAREGAYNPYLTIINALNSDTWTVPSLPSGARPLNHHKVASKPANCFDAYYNITIARNAGAYATTQRYRIEAVADNASVVDTNTFPNSGEYDTGHPRQLFVERILSQARNDVLGFQGPTTVEVGGVYDFTLTSQTATGYPQLTISSTFPNIIFQILNVTTRYSSDPGLTNSSIYANACGWISDPTYPGYHTSSSTCDYPLISDQDGGDGKVGNTVTTQYKIKILSTGSGNPSSTQYKVNHLISDFSGGSYHYNSDYGDVAGGGGVVITIVDPKADLNLTKSHTGNFATGDNTYTLAVTNNGPNTAKGPITVVDTLPTGFSYVSVSGTNWTCSANSQVVTCTNPNDLPVGSSTLNLTVNVGSSAASNSLNTATVSSPTSDPNLTNNKAADPTNVVQGPNLSLTKTHTPATFNVGQTGTYTLTVSNSSSFNASGPLTIVDTLPTGLIFNSASNSTGSTGWTCSANGQNVVCTNPSGLNAGQTTAVNLIVNVGSSVASSVTNTATVSSSSFDTNLSDNTASDLTQTTKPSPDLKLTKTDNDQQFVFNSTSTTQQNGVYVLTVINESDVPTVDTITVQDTLPSALGYFSGISAPGSSGWTCSASGSIVTCTNPNPLAGRASSSILLTVTPKALAAFPGVLNTASVSLPPGAEQTTTNNDGSDATPIVAPAKSPIDLIVVKKLTRITPPNQTAISPTCTTSGRTDTCTSTIAAGNTVEYTVDVINNSSGSGDDSSITLKDIVPTALTNVSWVCDYVDINGVAGGSGRASGSGNSINACNPSNTTSSPQYRATGTGNNISLSTISLRKGGGKVRFTITGTVQSSFTGTLSNTATAAPSSASGADLDIADNTYTVNATVPGADLKVDKVTVGSFVQGVNSIYRVTVRNESTALTANQLITVKDTLPTSLTYVSASSATGSTGWTCSYDTSTRTVTCVNNNSLSPGATTAIDITVIPTASPVSNTATVAMAGDTNPNNNLSAVGPTTVTAANPDLSITKVASGTFALGQEATYGITVSNSSSATSTVAVAPFTVTDTLPSGLSFLSGSGNGWICSASGQDVTCTNYSNLTPGSSSSFNLKVLVGSSTPSSVSNIAKVTPVNGETATANNTSSAATTAIAQQADLAIAKTLSGALFSGQQGTYILTVTNNGPSAIPSGTAITVTDTLPTGLSFVSGSGDGFNCSAGTPVTCSKTNGLSVGGQAVIALNVSVSATAGSPLVNTAQVTSSIADANTNNNTSPQATTTVQSSTVGLSLTKNHFGSIPVGGEGTYTLQVKNTGNVPITNTIKLVDTLPSNLTLLSTVGTGWSCTGTSTVTCVTNDSLAVGATNAVDLVVKVGTGTPVGTNSITNTASAFLGSSTTASATSNDPTTIAASADLSLTKTAATQFVVGQQAQYTLTVTNAATSSGAANAPITLVDELPTGLTYVSSTGTGWNCSTTSADPNITCTLSNTLAVGSQSVLTLTVQVGSTVVSPFTNYATVYSSTSDPNSLNNAASVTNSVSTGTVANPKLLLVKRITAINQTAFTTVVDGSSTPGNPNYVASPQDQDDNNSNWPSGFLKGIIHQTIKPGDNIEFTMYFLSTGSAPAQNVLFCDLVPSNVTFSKAGFNTVPAANGPSPVPGVTQTGGDQGIVLGMGTQSTASPYPILVSLSNTSDSDAGRYIEPGVNLTTLDTRLSSCGNNTNGAIVVNLGTLPNATAAGNPPGSYGFVRFKGFVN